MKYIWKIFFIAVAMVTAMPSFAVTDKEMEQARTIAAKHYLRYANNGSDYLDKINPTSMGELTKSLKAKEQENIKSFNAVAVPKDYASWDKKKLVEYWSSTFFRSPGLKDDGKKCLSILAKNLNKMTVSAPSATPKPAETAAAEQKPAEVKEQKPAEVKKEDPAAAKAPAPANASPKASANPAAAGGQTPAAQQPVDEASAVAQAEADAGIADEQPKKSSNTGWYVGILVVLVGVVIWLVMYASKSMKESGASLADHAAGEKEIRDAKRSAKEELNKMREQYATSLTSKNDEIKQLKAQCQSFEVQLDSARHAAESARRELDAAKRELAALRQRAKGQNAAPESQAEGKPQPLAEQPQQRQPREQKPAPAPSKPQEGTVKAPVAARPGGLPPVVFLSYVNQKGLFVKASRSINVETSVYKMDIPDGHHGTFRVINDADLLDRFLENPEMWLSGGCVIENPEDADIAVEIVTLQPGEALFADNSCRVTKKARIKFI
ncbi:MAG: hypothetical protein K2I92_05560 [Muribaculaceae bacterium]|nr:hypothetical protein [Muribaculaceae bacterium]